jgi:DNA-binding MarR family transcriptional regulator
MSKRTAWYRSLQAHVVLIQLCDNELRRDCGIPMVWYDVLVKLWLAPEQSLRMSELADQALLSRSWLTRRVIQLEQAGLVERTSADGDRRGVRATMTEKGKQVFLDWEQSHSRSIERHFSRHLSNDEATVIAAAFDRIAQEGRRSLAGSAPTVDTASRSSPDA